MSARQLLEGAYDIHVHASPDVIPRALDLSQLCAEAENAGMAGILIKDHCTSTVGRAAVLNQMGRGACHFFSALALNPPVGGLNPTAVESSLRAGVDVIYFPTYGAAHHIAIWGAGQPPTAFPLPAQGFNGINILDENLNVRAEAMEILKLIAEYGAVVATGHISPQESLVLLKQAREIGIKRMLVTHASESVPAFTEEEQKAAVNLGAMVEHSFFAATSSCPHSISFETMGNMIRAVGVAHVVLSSDFGQVANGNPVQGYRRHLEKLQAHGFSTSEIREMISTNPQRILGH